jgi:alpha-tubulin suppressor-like RCC1 family protein
MVPRLTSLAAFASLALAACNSSETTGPGSNPDLGRRLIAGETVACALTSTGQVYCWGLNSNFWDYGASPGVKPGGGAPTEAIVPILKSLGRGLGTHFCGLNLSNDAVCWARDGSGQLGRGVVLLTGNSAGVVVGGTHWKEVFMGRLTTCGLSDANLGFCWGFNQSGTVGASRFPVGVLVHTPTQIDSLSTLKDIAAGWLHACAITTAGAAYCWGNNVHGQLGISSPDTASRLFPLRVTGATTFASLAMGSRHTCALATDGDAWCWGANATGQLGDGSTTPRLEPVRVSGGIKFTQLVSGSGFANGSAVQPPVTGADVGTYGHTCGLTAAGKAYCWGWNGNGQLGDGTQTDRFVPTAVSGNLTFETLALGSAYTCGMQGDNVWCWGSNLNGQLGGNNGGQVGLTPSPVAAPFKAP